MFFLLKQNKVFWKKNKEIVTKKGAMQWVTESFIHVNRHTDWYIQCEVFYFALNEVWFFIVTGFFNNIKSNSASTIGTCAVGTVCLWCASYYFPKFYQVCDKSLWSLVSGPSWHDRLYYLGTISFFSNSCLCAYVRDFKNVHELCGLDIILHFALSILHFWVVFREGGARPLRVRAEVKAGVKGYQ